ncbi:protein Diedel-like [Scaptodrosophila lebanonensis]|uniref:Protein Diedel-like n=1 Tax=Drosophila lebanonensis TaxID=7225 RepID=A0A6J2UJ47_DROLE|nr:protein Diedel-like [Scaptodrosophila lebanonensis]
MKWLETIVGILLLGWLPAHVLAECCHSTTLVFTKTSSEDSCKSLGGHMPWSGSTSVGETLSKQMGNIINNACEAKVCGNGQPVVGTYCGYGSCNAFGCNCDFGCIAGDAAANFKSILGEKVEKVRPKTIFNNIASG